MHSKPLRFLYKKYASQAPQGGNGFGVPYKYGDLLSQKSQSGSLGQLHQLGREFTKLERIQMYFDFSDDPGVCPSQTYSSVGSASTNGRSINSKKDLRSGFSPTRYRSKSQEFQSKYRLALSRSSPEQKHCFASQNHSSVSQLPSLQQNNNLINEKSTVNAHPDININTNTQGKQEHASSATTAIHSNQRGMIQRGDTKIKSLSANHMSMSPANLHIVIPQATDVRKDHNEKFPRCNSSSTIDADRIDSSQYQYLLDDVSSVSSSTTLCSIKSDQASSHFSARAQRPSTTGTSRATHRLRDLQTCTTNGTPTSRSKSRHNSFNKSPENQWPPRYAIIPSWPSYEDIQTLNSCGEHRSVLTQLYRKGNRRIRDKSNKLNMWNSSMRYHQRIHVVPSHTNMECTMCNLYSQNVDPTVVPPNSPMVVSHDCHDEQSRRSTSFSLLVNRSSTNLSMTNGSSKNHSVINSSLSAHTKPLGSADKAKTFHFNTRMDRRSDSSQTKSPNRLSDALQLEPTKKPNVKHVSYNRPSKKDVSYSWDTCKFAYVKAKA